jgi:hypothetical protein
MITYRKFTTDHVIPLIIACLNYTIKTQVATGLIWLMIGTVGGIF